MATRLWQWEHVSQALAVLQGVYLMLLQILLLMLGFG
jgi:hypothetical protein